MDQVSECLRYYQELIKLKYYLQADRPIRYRREAWYVFWVSREPGMSMVQLSKRFKISQPTESQSATCGEKIAKENRLKLLQNK